MTLTTQKYFSTSYKLFVQYLVVKPACVNAADDKITYFCSNVGCINCKTNISGV